METKVYGISRLGICQGVKKEMPPCLSLSPDRGGDGSLAPYLRLFCLVANTLQNNFSVPLGSGKCQEFFVGQSQRRRTGGIEIGVIL